MARQFSSLVCMALLMAAFVPGLSPAQSEQGQAANPSAGNQPYGNQMGGGQGGGYPGNGAQTVVCPGGCYGGFHPFNCRAYSGPGYYGFFRRYYGYPYYGPSYRSGAMSTDLGYGLGNGLVYRSGGSRYAPPPAGVTLSSSASDASTTPSPQSDNAAHLQLVVPANAEVLVDGGKTTQTGTIREFVSPPLSAEKTFTYQIAVRGTDAHGKTIDDQRTVRIHANDSLRIDFTQPESPEPALSPRRPAQ